jgi:hypothetical protein
MRSRPALSAARKVAAAWSPLLLAVLSLSALAAPQAAGAPAAPRAGAVHLAPFVLDDQSEWVVAPKAPGSATFHIGITARRAPSNATVQAILYPRLRTRYDFEHVVRSGPRGTPVSSTSPVPLSSLLADPRAPAGVSLDLSVVPTASSGQGERLGLGCAPPTGSGTCTGVYPVVVELQHASGGVVDRFTTFLTYVAGKSSHQLELAWVVPVTAPVSISPNASSPANGIRALTPAQASALEGLIAEVRAAPSVPVTLDVSPETLQALKRAGPSGRAADSELSALSVSSAADQVLASSYVPIDLGALEGAGEPTEVVAQMAAGATVLRHLRIRTTGGSSPWVQSGPVGNDIAGGLSRIGAHELVLPSVDLAPTANATTSGTWASTFSLSLAHGGSAVSVQAAETDTWLDGQFADLHGDPALAATQLLADLAMIHFERPNTTAVRGMVALPPLRWLADGVFDRVLFEGLSQNPVVLPVTLSTFFATVTADGTRHLLKTGGGPVLRHSLARSISRARLRLSNFDDAVAHHPPVTAELDDLLLASEAENLTSGRQANGVSAFERVITKQLSLVTLATPRTFTLTARTGWIPITVESRATYTVEGTLSVSGNKFTFPRNGARHFMRLDHATNSRRVYVLARTSGDLPLHVTFTSPNGRLVIARGLLTVRSTATSVVGIVLTAVALAILLTWWARTWRSGRRRRRRLQRAGEAPGAGATAS